MRRARDRPVEGAEPLLAPIFAGGGTVLPVVGAAELEDPADEARYGASVAHVRAVAALAADLAARGRVLPTLRRHGGRAFARWRPVVQGLDAVAFDALVGALPPVGRAEAVAPDAGPDPHDLVADALEVLTDAAVRD